MSRNSFVIALSVAISAKIAFSPAAHAQNTLFRVDGDVAQIQMGHSVGRAGDVNHDGYNDVLVGSYLDNNSRGKARVVSGKTGATIYTIVGAAGGDHFGRALAGVGDINADGFDDFIIGGWYADTNGSNAGVARVYSGKTGAVLYAYNGSVAFEHLGTAVAGVGDVNGDGRPDFAIGADAGKQTTNGPKVGWVRIYSGATGAALYTVYGTSPDGRFGAAIDGAGDCNGDGRADFVVGAEGDDAGALNGGSVYVFSGANGALLFRRDGSADDYLGFSVAGAGDVNGDGRGDIIAGAPYADPSGQSAAGRALVFSGANGQLLLTLAGDAALQNFGYAVGSLGDIDGDGRSDLVVGSPYANVNGNQSGSVRVFSGASGAQIFMRAGDSAADLFGSSVAGVGDINNDGTPDLIAGAVWEDPNGLVNGGSAFVISCASGCSGTKTIYGSGCAGSGGFVPTMTAIGCPSVGNTLTFEIRKGLGGAKAIFVLGDHRISGALGNGCSVLVAPQRRFAVVTLAGSGAGNGSAQLSVLVPPTAFGTTIEMQGFVVDPSSIGWPITSNAVEVVFE